jgi:hypothetical protein
MVDLEIRVRVREGVGPKMRVYVDVGTAHDVFQEIGNAVGHVLLM